MDIENAPNIIGHLGTQFERASPILLTGAGFSRGAKNIAGEPLPTGYELREVIWNLCFDGEPFEESSTLSDLYQIALRRHPAELTNLLTASLTVDSDSLPSWYRDIFNLPWHRCYTLNIDDLPSAIQRKYQFRRELVAISATTERSLAKEGYTRDTSLEIVHLNGTLGDLPRNVTFSLTHYAERLSRDEPWYIQFVTDMASRPVVFIGTQLDEPPMWQHIERRRSRGGRGEKELRPKSYLVTTSISKARQSCLSEFNITMVKGSAIEFCAEVLAKLGDSVKQGHLFLKEAAKEHDFPSEVLSEVGELSSVPITQTEFLFGAEPIWADIQANRAIERETDIAIQSKAIQLLKSTGVRGILLVTGTAGTGKSTSLKRLGLAMNNLGYRVGWVEQSTNISPRAIKKDITGISAPTALIIDDADLYGGELSPLLKEIALYTTHPLVIIGIRSGKIDRVINPTQLKAVPISEVPVPGLTDSDIRGLVAVLERENRLGALVRKTAEERENVFREKCGRQLLVAMLEATSGAPFETKIVSELEQLEPEQHKVYALVALVTSWRFQLSRNEILMAIGDVSNKVLNAIEKLAQRKIIVGFDLYYQARHKVIAEVVARKLTQSGQLAEILSGLAYAAATAITPHTPHSARPRRLLQRIINHDFLINNLGRDESRNLYGEMEGLLNGDFNFWLQRGSFELENGGLHFAEHCLNYARELNPDDLNVQTEYAYLLFLKAIAFPSGPNALQMVTDAINMLSANIAIRGYKDPHLYHVFGSNMLEWIKRGIASREDKKAEMQKTIKVVEEGVQKHPKNDHLKTLLSTLKDEYLSLAVVR